MNGNTPPDRRRFVKTAAAGMAGLAAGPGSALALREKRHGFPHEFCTFTKPLQHLSYDEVAEVIDEIGFDGVESAVRPKGHVEPERVGEDLPKMMESLGKRNLKLTVMTTAINEVSDAQHTEKVLRTAAGLGVKRYRMGYYRYDLKKPIRAQLDEVRPRLKDLVQLSRELGIKPVYQNHSGRDFVGGPIWDLEELFSEYEPDHVGACFDVGHATVEGAKAWPLHFALLRPYIDTIYIKDPGWQDNKLKWGALGEGSLDRGVFTTIKNSGFTGPISLHVEYLGHRDPKIVPTVIKAIRENFATLKGFLREA